MIVGSSSTVQVYSKQNCPQCVTVKRDFDIRGVKYTELLIDEDTEARHWLLEQGHKSVPVVYVDGRFVHNPGLIVSDKPRPLV